MTPRRESELPAIRRSVAVSWGPVEAFRRFTADFGGWWPRATHSVGGRFVKHVVFECVPGGRIYEELTDGRRFQWGPRRRRSNCAFSLKEAAHGCNSRPPDGRTGERKPARRVRATTSGGPGCWINGPAAAVQRCCCATPSWWWPCSNSGSREASKPTSRVQAGESPPTEPCEVGSLPGANSRATVGSKVAKNRMPIDPQALDRIYEAKSRRRRSRSGRMPSSVPRGAPAAEYGSYPRSPEQPRS